MSCELSIELSSVLSCDKVVSCDMSNELSADLLTDGMGVEQCVQLS